MTGRAYISLGVAQERYPVRWVEASNLPYRRELNNQGAQQVDGYRNERSLRIYAEAIAQRWQKWGD